MQTFLPYDDFALCAKVLDNKRLNKQIVECDQIFKSLTVSEYGWKNHPAVLMWLGYEDALLVYTTAMFYEWCERSGKEQHKSFTNICLREGDRVNRLLDNHNGWYSEPKWLGDERLHQSHRRNLTRKDPEFYGQFWSESPEEGYWWPTHNGF